MFGSSFSIPLSLSAVICRTNVFLKLCPHSATTMLYTHTTNNVLSPLKASITLGSSNQPFNVTCTSAEPRRFHPSSGQSNDLATSNSSHHSSTHSPSHTTSTMLAARVAARTARVAAPRISIAATRGYAEPAKPSANTKPPVEVFGLDGTYASALVSQSKPPNCMEEV